MSGYLLWVKKFLMVLFFFFFIVINYGCYTQVGSQQENAYQPPQDFNVDDLNEYGDWVVIPEFGEVWKPSVVDGWEPFYYGHWVYSDDGWTWISYEPFGWVVYHYGYWYYDDNLNYGWVWIPQNDGWSPAVVQWSKYDNYIAWAPLPPRGVSIGNPWDDGTPLYWHNVDSDSFMEDNVGKFEKRSPSKQNDTQVTKTRTNTNVDNNSATRTGSDSDTKTSATRNSTGNGRNADNSAPTSDDINDRTGREVTKTKVTREKSSSSSNLDKINLPEDEKERVTKNQETVKKEVIVPRSSNNSSNNNNSNSSENKQKSTTRNRN